MTAKWADVDLGRGIIALLDSKTGKKNLILNAPAKQLLTRLPRIAGNPYAFPGRKDGEHLVNVNKLWASIRKKAGIEDVRLRDLRHSFASIAVSGGVSLPLIGGLLGHAKASTTQRYAHLSGRPSTPGKRARRRGDRRGGEARREKSETRRPFRARYDPLLWTWPIAAERERWDRAEYRGLDDDGAVLLANMTMGDKLLLATPLSDEWITEASTKQERKLGERIEREHGEHLDERRREFKELLVFLDEKGFDLEAVCRRCWRIKRAVLIKMRRRKSRASWRAADARADQGLSRLIKGIDDVRAHLPPLLWFPDRDRGMRRLRQSLKDDMASLRAYRRDNRGKGIGWHQAADRELRELGIDEDSRRWLYRLMSLPPK